MKESIGKREIRPPVKSQPLKISAQKFAHVITSGTATTVQIFVKIGSAGASPQKGDFVTYLTVLSSCLYLFSRSCAQVEPLDRFSRFRGLWLKRRVFAQGSAFGCYNDRWRHLGKISLQNPLKVGANRQFQAKRPKYENCSISKTVNPIKPKFEDKAETTTCISWLGYHCPKPNPTWLAAAILKIAMRS